VLACVDRKHWFLEHDWPYLLATYLLTYTSDATGTARHMGSTSYPGRKTLPSYGVTLKRT
jgi:hypothetical protein